MSVYTIRFYEVKTPIVHDYLNKIDEFKKKYIDEPDPSDKPIPDGYTVKVWEGGPIFKIWSESDKEWKDENDCRHEWVLLRWYVNGMHSYSPKKYEAVVGEVNEKPDSPYDEYKRKPIVTVGEKLREIVTYCDNGGVIRDEYIREGYGTHESFANRGFPKDMSPELKAILSDENEIKYTWGHTYVYVSEWEAEYERLLEKFKGDLERIYREDGMQSIEERLDIIEKTLKDPSYKKPRKKKKKDDEYDNEETTDQKLQYLWEENFWDMQSVKGEYMRAYHLIDEPFGWTDGKDIRIVYYLE